MGILPKPPSHGPLIQGEVAPGFELVRQAFVENFERRGEIGAAMCVYHQGVQVVDLWAGWADKERTIVWEADTPALLFSTTKGLVAIAFLMLADHGVLDLDAPIAEGWPEFGRKGKEHITIRQLLNHRAGLAALDVPVTLEMLGDREQITPILEQQEPLWEPGKDQGYHAVTFGAYTAEIFRRAAGRTLGEFLAERVAGPLGADFWLGLPDEQHARVAKLYPNSLGKTFLRLLPEVITGNTQEGRILRAVVTKGSDTHRAFLNPRNGKEGLGAYDDPEVFRMELPWANGIGTARGLARIYAALAEGGRLDGVRLCSSEALPAAMVRQSSVENDRIMRAPLGFSQGFLKVSPQFYSPFVDPFGHSGLGGSLAFADPPRRLAWSYVMNRSDHRVRSPRSLVLCDALYACLGHRREDDGDSLLAMVEREVSRGVDRAREAGSSPLPATLVGG